MAGGGNAHGSGVGVFANGFFIHFEEVGVPFPNGVLSQSFNSVTEVEVGCVMQRPDPETFVDLLGDSTRSHVTGHQVTECRIAPLQEVVAFLFGDGVGVTIVFGFDG